MKRILIIQGHPDPRGGRFGHALADAYACAAAQAGHEVQRLDIAKLDFALLRTKEEFDGQPPCEAIQSAQQAMVSAQHLVIFFPLWLGGMPALLKGFLEQALRPGFAFDLRGSAKQQLKGKSARIVVTMGMPSLVYRWYFGAHGLKSLSRSILGFCGMGPVRTALVGNVEGSARGREKWMQRMRGLGAEGG